MENSERYSKYYSEESFWKKLRRFAGKAGVKVAYVALLLYYMLVDDTIAMKSKMTIVAALGYFIFPIDLIPDFAPLIGFTDDLSVLMVAFSIVKGEINNSHRQKARQTLAEWFKGVDEHQLLDIENGRTD
ncbi:MAG: YkvA family protein [Mariniphaga sp.]